MKAYVDANVSTKFNNFFRRIILFQIVVERFVDLIQVRRHVFAVAQRRLFGVAEPVAGFIIIDAFVDVFFRQSLLLRRSRPYVASIIADGVPGQLDADDFLELMIDHAGIKHRAPGHIHGFGQVRVVALHGMERRVGRTVLQGLLNIRRKLGLVELINIKHRNIRHSSSPKTQTSIQLYDRDLGRSIGIRQNAVVNVGVLAQEINRRKPRNGFSNHNFLRTYTHEIFVQSAACSSGLA
jgi:hypothetical protein